MGTLTVVVKGLRLVFNPGAERNVSVFQKCKGVQQLCKDIVMFAHQLLKGSK